ncbi:MAG: putative DNA binding domain-containing protein, partial [Bacilli bacterium]|nr:putative DNA binding domain-containing protein [Bacilli bacterium]
MKLTVKENENIEFKESLSQLDKGLKSLTAMLNRSNNGILYFGVKDDGTVCGCDVGEKTFQDIRQRASELVQPKIVLNIKKETLEDKTIVIVCADGVDIPYSCDGRYYIRNVASDEKVDNYLLRKMFEVGDGDLIKHHESYLQELTFNQFIEYNRLKGLHASNSVNFYKSKGLFTPNNKFNYMSFLLSDQSNISIKVVRFNGKDKASFSERTEYGSKCLFYSVDEVINAIKAINVTKIEIVDGIRKETPLFDFEAFREAWINACMHNHWIDELPPAIYIYDDRIEVFSYGNKPF